MKIDTTMIASPMAQKLADAINEHEDRIARLEKQAGLDEDDTYASAIWDWVVCPCCGAEMKERQAQDDWYWACECGLETGCTSRAAALADVRALQR